MKVRVSFFKRAEVVNGRAPRYTVDVEASSVSAARQQIAEPGVTIIRRAYKAPDTPISSKPSYVFETEHYRVSYYKTDELVHGRAPRYMVDVEADDYETAQAKVLAMEPNPDVVVIRSIYKAPDTLLPTSPSYVFPKPSDRNTWYSSHKTAQTIRLCHGCKTEPVTKRYGRFCDACEATRNPERLCKGCGTPLVKAKRKRKTKSTATRNFCEPCGLKHKETQEKTHREKRAKQTTVERIQTQIAWAQEKLLTTPLLSCKLASRFQGLRLPHITNEATRCRTCLQKFIDVQTVYLNNLMAEDAAEEAAADDAFNALFTENDHAHAHAATA
jgi:hypothetical protein